MALVYAIEKISRRKGCSISDIALAWVKYHSSKPGFPEIIPIPGATSSNRVEQNTNLISLTDLEYKELNSAVEAYKIVRTRYP